MTQKELASNLDGIEYKKLVNFHSNIKNMFYQAKENGLVVVFGASDDLMEFSGAIEDEADCYDGGIVCFDKLGVINEDEFARNSIKAFWCIDNVPWLYETEIPHESFMVMEDGEVYCIGIVFSIKDLK